MYGFVAAALGALPLLAQAVSAPTATSFPTPSEDPFYDIPSNIGTYKDGEVIRARTVQTTEFGALVSAQQLFYRTTNRRNKATGTVTTVFIPPAPVSPPQILSYQSPEDALNIKCAPSWANVNSSSEQESYFSEVLTLLVPEALASGQYVINSDDEDEDSEWLVGVTEGRATLDGIRAAINQFSLSKPKVAMLGYSGGAHETVWAASLAATYADEIDFVAAAYGGTPVDLAAAYTTLNGGAEAALAGGAIVGLANGYPRLNRTLNRLLTAEGKKIVAAFRSTEACIVEDGNFTAGYNFSSPAFIKGGNPLDNPVISRILAKESLLSNVSSLPIPVPKFPRYEWHGTADTTVPYQPEVEYIQQQCAKGADIVFVPYPGLNHTEAAAAGLPDALKFIDQAFSGTLVKGKCGSTSD